MKSAVETLSPTRVKLVVEVPFDELKPDLDKAYQTIGSQIQIPGFRKGKVPARIIDQRVGRGAVVQEAVNEALPRFFAEAVDAEGIKAIGQPEVDVTAVPLEDGQDFEFTVETDVRPESELPELDDEFAQLASQFDTLDELREDVAKQAEQAKKFEQGIQARDKVLEHLLDSVEVAVPDGIVEAEVNSHLEGEDRLDDDEHRAEVDESTRKALKGQFLLDALSEKLEISVDQPELIEYLIMSAQQYGMDPNQFAQAIEQQGQIPSMVQEVARRKALAAVLEKAVVTDTAGNTIDLNELVPQAETVDPVAEGDLDEDAETEIDEVVEDEPTKA